MVKGVFFVSIFLCIRMLAVIPDDSTEMPQGECWFEDYQKIGSLIDRKKWHHIIALEKFLRT